MSITPAGREFTASERSAHKRPYVRPELKRFGDLTQLTQAKGMSGHDSDGALANNNKTR